MTGVQTCALPIWHIFAAAAAAEEHVSKLLRRGGQHTDFFITAVGGGVHIGEGTIDGKGKGRTYGRWYKNSKDQVYTFKDGSGTTVYLQSDYPHLYYGRGYVQLTWFNNFKKASEKLKHDFLNNPDDVMQIEHATNILLLGMKEGWFTGRKLSDYINQSKKDYLNARRIINGMDKASLIAGYAETFEKALRSY